MYVFAVSVRQVSWHLEFGVRGSLLPKVCHDGGQYPVTSRLPRSSRTNERGPKANIEHVEHLNDLAHK